MRGGLPALSGDGGHVRSEVVLHGGADLREGRHRAGPRVEGCDHLVERGLELVEVGADRAGRAGLRERVAVAAARHRAAEERVTPGDRVASGRDVRRRACVNCSAAVTVAAAQQKPLKPFTFILDFLPYGEYTPYFTALEKGWYREEGLDVKIIRGAGSGDTIKRIAVGQAEAGSADFSALVGAKANEDIKVRAIGAYFRRPPHSIFVREGTGINSAKDLAGKTLSITPGNSHQILFPLLAKLGELLGQPGLAAAGAVGGVGRHRRVWH